MQKETTITEIIQALLDTEKPFPASLLYAFSDLEQQESTQLMSWSAYRTISKHYK